MITSVDTGASSVDFEHGWRLTDAGTTHNHLGTETAPTPRSVRLRRVSDTVTGSYSYDGKTWTSTGSQIFTQALTDPVLLGVPFACDGGSASAEVEWFRARMLVEPEPSVTLAAEEPFSG